MQLQLPRLLPVSMWPATDRRMWKAAQEGSYNAGIDTQALPAIASGYARWLSVLMSLGLLDRDQAPGDRVTPTTVQTFIAELRRSGNSDKTIGTRLSQIGSALRIMAPQLSFTWLHPRKLLADQTKPAVAANAQWKDWPDGDQLLWEVGLQVGDILDKPNHSARLRPATLHAAVVGYRRWLVFLRTEDLLDPDATPASRVSRKNVAAYFKSLRGSHCNSSVIARLTELRSALLIMHPNDDFQWLTSPNGRSLSSILPVSTKPIQIIDSKVLYDWGLTMAQNALRDPNPENRRIAYRNGILIALFAARAPRVRSMASLRLGQTITRTDDTYRVVFEFEDIKTGRRLEYHTPSGLSTAIDRYVAVERAELLGAQSHNWLWLNQYGEPLSDDDIGNMIQRQSKQTFGKGFGPHRFRHALGTTAPLADPAHPGVAAAILGVSEHMVEQHYNRANHADVARTFHSSLSNTRTERRAVARREFRTDE